MENMSTARLKHLTKKPGAQRSLEETTARRGTLLIAYGHTTVDFSQGAIAALMPFLVLQGGYSYSAAAGIMLTFSLVSSIIQPVLGIMGDKWRMRWLIPVSVFLSGLGIAAIGLVNSYWAVALLASAAGIGVAAFHPASASRAREVSGGDHVLMSWYSLGGNFGFALGPVIVAITVGIFGLNATPLLMIPALSGVIAVLVLNKYGAATPVQKASVDHTRRDDWVSFGRMSVAIVCRSIVFVGIGTFIVLFMHEYRGVQEDLANASLFIFLHNGCFWHRGGRAPGAPLETHIFIAVVLFAVHPAASRHVSHSRTHRLDFHRLGCINPVCPFLPPSHAGPRLFTTAYEYRQRRDTRVGCLRGRNCNTSHRSASRQDRLGVRSAAPHCLARDSVHRVMGSQRP